MLLLPIILCKIVLKENEIIKGNVSIAFPEKEMRLSKQNITIGIFDEKGKMITSYNTTFEYPFKFAL